VRRVGRVPQDEGARLLTACDLYVSPHNSHMVDGKFFGSPTKIFEYMALAGGIVASDLEQIGEVLSPALRPADLARPDLAVTNQRSVLCAPGSVDEFVAGVVGLVRRRDVAGALGRNARQAIADTYSWRQHVARLWAFAAGLPRDSGAPQIETGDAYKGQVQNQWNNNPVGSETARSAQPHTLEWFQEVERYRHDVYAPWMPRVMEFAEHAGEQVLEVGGGMGTDLAQFAKHGAIVTDVDLSGGHLQIAQENFRLRGLTGRFVHHDAESLPFDDNTFDLVYSNGVLHHTPNTTRAVSEILRVLKPGGRAIVMVYAENSLQYWRNLVWHHGMKGGEGLANHSMGDIMSRTVERTGNEARPLVKVYTKPRLRRLFHDFASIHIVQRQISPEIVPRRLRWFLPLIERMAGWNLIIKARKPQRS
jgi:ubiquinone/menaquinone biosynthesis C-methylase UbiE